MGFRDRAKPSFCVCGHRRMWHANGRTDCSECGCGKFHGLKEED